MTYTNLLSKKTKRGDKLTPLEKKVLLEEKKQVHIYQTKSIIS